MRNHFTLDPLVPRSIPDGDDLTYLADILIDLTLPEHTMATSTLPTPTLPTSTLPTSILPISILPEPTTTSGPAPTMKRREPKVIIDLVDDGHPQPAEIWALNDDSEVGRVVSPITMRRLRGRWIRYRSGVDLDSPQALYYPSIRGFARLHARRLTGRCPEMGPRVQHRIEGFLHLDDDEFNACYNYLGDPTPEYLQLCRRLDNHHRPDSEQPSPAVPGDGHRRRAKAAQLDLRDQPS